MSSTGHQGNLFEYAAAATSTTAEASQLVASTSPSIAARRVIIEGLRPYVEQIEREGLSPLAAAEAFSFYADTFTRRAQQRVIDGEGESVGLRPK
jgi:hypothetical protein